MHCLKTPFFIFATVGGGGGDDDGAMQRDSQWNMSFTSDFFQFTTRNANT